MAAVTPILGKPAALVEPAYGALDQPSLRQHRAPMQFRPLDDFDLHLTHRLLHGVGKAWALLAGAARARAQRVCEKSGFV